jgi:hypothetical protein
MVCFSCIAQPAASVATAKPQATVARRTLLFMFDLPFGIGFFG